MSSISDSSGSVLPLPHRFGRYRLSKLLAVGGMAQIYLAKSYGAEGFVKPLVIKRLDPQLAKDERFTQLFVNEAKMLVSLNHGNIVPVFDFGRVGQDLYMAMEFIRGTSLRDLVRTLAERKDSLNVQVAAHIAAEICKGLDYAHRKSDDRGRPAGIIHRDIKPSNILISREGEVKIVDFGVAKLAHRPSDREFSGTVAYMSPEQANLQEVDSRTDIFSTGLLLYELLGLRPAYDGPSAREALGLARVAELPPIAAHVPSELAAIVSRATAKDPNDRYAAAHDMEHDLTEFLVLARSVGVTVDSEPMASKLSGLLRELPSLSLTEPLFDDETDTTDPDHGPGLREDLTAPTMDLAQATVPTETTANHLELTQPPIAGASAEPPDLALIRDAAETFHSEFISRMLDASPEQRLGMTAEVAAVPPSSTTRRVVLMAVLVAVFGAGVASTWFLGGRGGGEPAPVANLAVDGARRAAALPPDAGQPIDAKPRAPDLRPDTKPPKQPPRRPRKYGYLNLSSIPWSRVTIDGRRYKRPTPLMRLRLRAGLRTVVLENRGRKLRKVVRIRIRPDQTISKVVKLKR